MSHRDPHDSAAVDEDSDTIGDTSEFGGVGGIDYSGLGHVPIQIGTAPSAEDVTAVPASATERSDVPEHEPPGTYNLLDDATVGSAESDRHEEPEPEPELFEAKKRRTLQDALYEAQQERERVYGPDPQPVSTAPPIETPRSVFEAAPLPPAPAPPVPEPLPAPAPPVPEPTAPPQEPWSETPLPPVRANPAPTQPQREPSSSRFAPSRDSITEPAPMEPVVRKERSRWRHRKDAIAVEEATVSIEPETEAEPEGDPVSAVISNLSQQHRAELIVIAQAIFLAADPRHQVVVDTGLLEMLFEIADKAADHSEPPVEEEATIAASPDDIAGQLDQALRKIESLKNEMTYWVNMTRHTKRRMSRLEDVIQPFIPCSTPNATGAACGQCDSCKLRMVAEATPAPEDDLRPGAKSQR